MRLIPKPYLNRTAVTLVWLAVTLWFIIWMKPDFWLTSGDDYRRARELLARGKKVEALGALNRALLQDPGNTGFLISKGYLELELGEIHSAIESFQRVIASKAADVQATLGLAKAYFSAGDHDQARQKLDSLENTDLAPPELRRRGQLRGMMGDHGKSLRDIMVLLEKSPGDPELLRESLSLACALQDWNLVISLSSRLLQATSERAIQAEAKAKQAMALHQLGRMEEAYALYNELAGGENLETRAKLSLQLERYEESVGLYKALIDERPGDQQLRKELAYALERSGRTREADGVYESILNAGGADREARIRYAWLCNRKGRYKKAWSILEPLPQPDDDLEVLELQARTAYWAGEMKEAAVLLRALLERKMQNHKSNDTSLPMG